MLGYPQVFWPGVPKPVFFVASRGHHADIGGITPGSMPPHSKALREEGAVFVSFKLVKDGVFQEEGEPVLGTWWWLWWGWRGHGGSMGRTVGIWWGWCGDSRDMVGTQ